MSARGEGGRAALTAAALVAFALLAAASLSAGAARLPAAEVWRSVRVAWSRLW